MSVFFAWLICTIFSASFTTIIFATRACFMTFELSFYVLVRYLTHYLLLLLFAIIRIIASLFRLRNRFFRELSFNSLGARCAYSDVLSFFSAVSSLFLPAVQKKANVVKSPDSDGQRVKASQRPYTVNGQRYEPLRSHEGFVQTGVASWYGKDFHGKRTSNGEITICTP